LLYPWVKILTELAGGAGADVMTIHYTFFHDFARRGVFLDLGPLVRRDGYDLDDFFKVGLDCYTCDGKLQGIPYKGSARLIIYNKKLFDDAGVAYPDDTWDWNDFLKAARRLTRDRDGDGRIDQYGTLFANDLLSMLPWIWSNGGDWLSGDGRECVLHRPEAVEAVRFCADWVLRTHVAPSNRELTTMSGDIFSTGRIGMMISGPWAVPTLRRIKSFAWDAAPFPKGKAGRISRYAGMGYCIWKGTKHPDAAWEFVKFLADPKKGGKMLAEAGLDVPARKSLANSPVLLREDTPWHEEEFVRSLRYARCFQPVSGFFEIDNIFTREIDLVVFGEKTVEQAMKSARKGIDLILRPL